jgi:hypothetical protein
VIRACIHGFFNSRFLRAFVVAAAFLNQRSTAATSCSAVAIPSLRDATITLGTIVEPGAFTPPAPGAGAQAYRRAVYKGAGSSDDAANFDCRTERD